MVWVWISIYQGATIMLLAITLFSKSFIEIVSITFTALVFIELLNVISSVSHFNKPVIFSVLFSLLLYIGCALFLRRVLQL